MNEPSPRQRVRGRAVAVSNGTLAAVLVAVLAMVALVVKPPSPPGIAAFAPQASKPITKAPPGQAALRGEGPGACAVGQRCASPSPHPTALPRSSSTPAPPGVASTVQCHVWPDGSVTQTYDRQSPPCIASWHDPHGNGGATAVGVTGQTIRLAGGTPPTTAFGEPWLIPLLNFINTRYQLYGRRLVYDFVGAASGGQRDGPSIARAAAAEIAARKPFAGLPGVNGNRDTAVFATTLAERRVLTVIKDVRSTITTDLLGRYAPYVWTVSPPVDVTQRTVGEFACRALVGRRADYAGEPLKGQPRKFVIASRGGDGDFEPRRRRSGARTGAACRIRCGVVAPLRSHPGIQPGFPRWAPRRAVPGLSEVLVMLNVKVVVASREPSCRPRRSRSHRGCG